MADTIINDDTTGPGRRPGGRIRPARRARHTAARAGGAMPAEWGGVIARAADFEPDNDGELLGWMGDEVSGVAGYAEALVDLYESCTAGIGLDPVAMAALHDVADAAAHAAETMSGARHRFADHYELPREFAANGGLMTARRPLGHRRRRRLNIPAPGGRDLLPASGPLSLHGGERWASGRGPARSRGIRTTTAANQW